MIAASGASKIVSMRGAFHNLVSGKIRAFTVESSGRILTGDCTLKVDYVGIHLSFQIQIFSPDPTFHLEPKYIISLAPKMLLQAYNALWGILASKNELFGKYFDLSTLYKRE